MKTKIITAILVLATLMSCNTNNTKQESSIEGKEHEVHGPAGVVVLNEKQRETLNLKLGTFQKRNLTTVVKINGQLEVPPSGAAEITSLVDGRVQKIKVFHGDKVKKGQILAVLEHPDYITLQEDFAEVANKLEYLKQEYERQKKLYENNVGAGRDYQQAKTAYKTAKAKYEGLKARLQLLHLSPEQILQGKMSKTINIYAPINGFVNEVNIKVGSYVAPKDKLFEVTDNSAIHADFMVYEKNVHLIKPGQKIHFTVSNRPGKEYTASVFAIGKAFENQSRAVHVHAKIIENVSGLIPGMYITGHLHTDKKYTNALPDNAIVREGTKSYIFIVDNQVLNEQEKEKGDHNQKIDENSMAFRMVEVIPGRQDDGYTEIHLIDSLPENTQIVLNAAYYLLADMKKEETEHEH